MPYNVNFRNGITKSRSVLSLLSGRDLLVV